ncbi:isoprenyl transferase [Kosmotoga pacifica]|uniref:Isoprenyl transferase n=1 Tax=Kosmotoga pacifica TaxID=1330330 RepID=A0A0G2ZDV5_9BACT|nr:isoprenyl transferase [Kosmotoga pacifica]AKI96978.1 UDP diphosphate synthase [Kosmotoga pacifica]
MKVPEHVAIIMDGNGRWAKQRGLNRVEGHKVGAKVAEDVSKWCADLGIKYLTLYAFSTENWKRPEEEIKFLFRLMVEYLGERLEMLLKESVKLRFMGRVEELNEETKQFCRQIEEKTAECNRLNLIVALNYGGRAEIVDAVNKIINEKLVNIDENTIRKHLYLPNVPDPDLIIRTSGEKRLSNFLLWQSSYSELYFTEVLWPDFSRENFIEALEEYSRRKRRYGAVIDNEK